MFVAYLRTFERMGLRPIPLRADTGPIGGDLSHEFVILADTGESEVFCHRDLLGLSLRDAEIDFDGDLEPIVERYTSYYAASDDKHDPDNCPVAADDLVSARGIEVGHIFHFGTKYSKPMGAVVASHEDQEVAVEMGSYGIGVSRLVGGIIEACHDDDGIVWPAAVAPFAVGLINLRAGDEKCDAASESFYEKLLAASVDVLYDDRDERTGAKFAAMDLIGLPWQVIIGPRGVKAGVVEVKNRGSGEREELSVDAALARLAG
jgi:prolyl-tRNA synthetase